MKISEHIIIKNIIITVHFREKKFNVFHELFEMDNEKKLFVNTIHGTYVISVIAAWNAEMSKYFKLFCQLCI